MSILKMSPNLDLPMKSHLRPCAQIILNGKTLWLGLLHAAFAVALLVFGDQPAQAATYYSKTNNAAPNTSTNWSSTRDGTGGAPTNFTTAGDVFIIQTNHTVTGTNVWSVTGTVQVESGATLNQGNPNLTTTNTTAFFTNGTFILDNGATYNLNYKHGTSGSTASIPGTTKTFGASSTVNINAWGDGTSANPNSIPSGVSWGNLTLNVPLLGGQWAQSANVITDIKGNFTLKATGGGANEFRLTAQTAYTLTIGGDLIIQGGALSGYSNTGMQDGSAIKIYGSYIQSSNTTFKTTSSTTGGVLDFIFDNAGGPSAVSFTQAGTFQVNRVRFTIGAGKILTLNSPFITGANSPTNALTVNGTLLCNGYNVTGGEPFVLAAGGTLGITLRRMASVPMLQPETFRSRAHARLMRARTISITALTPRQ